MPKIKIFVEGIAVKKFIADYVFKLFGIKLSSNDIVGLGGWNGIEKEKKQFVINSGPDKDEGINLLILDADDDKNNGGFEKRKQEIIEIKGSLGIEFELFLFPNNIDDGDLETLLSNIINPKNKEIFDCWKSFEECITKINKSYTIPARKTKIYAYLEVLHGNTNKEKDLIKDPNRNFLNTDHWNLDDDHLIPLKTFLTQFLF